MTIFEKVFLGVAAGLVSVLSKFMAHDYDNIARNFANLTADQVLNYQVGYGILTPILMIMGGFVAWVSDEPNRIKLVALAISAPALITTWAGGEKRAAVAVTDIFVASAYAQQAGAPAVRPDSSMPARFDPTQTRDIGTLDRVRQGVGTFFGYGKEPPLYRVVVGSFASVDNARRYADEINRQNPGAPLASVAPPRPGNPNYAVVLGDSALHSKALEIQQLAVSRGLSDAWLSPEKRP